VDRLKITKRPCLAGSSRRYPGAD